MRKQNRLIPSLFLALILSAGAATAWAFISGVAWDALARRAQRSMHYDELIVGVDGTPAIVTTHSDDYRLRTYRSLDGVVIAPSSALQSGTLSAPAGPRGWIESPQQREWSWRICSATDGRLPPEYWYLVMSRSPDRRAWMEGFDSVTRRRIGYLGRRGFSAERPRPGDCFAWDRAAIGLGGSVAGTRLSLGSQPVYGELSPIAAEQIPPWQIFLVSAGDLLVIDLRARTVNVLRDDGDLVSVSIVQQAAQSVHGSHAFRPPQRLVVRAADRLMILHPASGEQRSVPLPESLRNEGLAVHDLVDQLLVWPLGYKQRAGAGTPLFWLGVGGGVLRQQTVTLATRARPLDVPWIRRLALIVTLPIPLLLGLAAFVIQPLVDMDNGQAAGYLAALGTACAQHALAAALVALAALGLAAWCFFRHRRLGLPGAWAWFVFVLLLGPPGLVGYLLHRRWPSRVLCPACQRRVPRDRDACLACGTDFPTPAPTGLEIFG